ncbi:MAG: aldose epimerase family protein [Candidatus Limnocylindria bacterium]
MSAENLLAIDKGPIHLELLPEVGARLHRLRVFGHDLLRTPDDPAEHARDPFRWGAYVMAPWCNRIAAGPTEVDGRLVDLRSNFPDGTAIHGQLYAARWDVESDGSLSTTRRGDGWPWRYRSSLRITLNGAVLTIDQSLTNLGPGPMPAGLGLHPWFRRPLDLRVAAEAVIPTNLDSDASVEPVAGVWDLRRMRPAPDDLDATWLAPGDPAVELRWPEIDVQAVMRVRSDAGVCICVASPSSLDAVAVEPQTHAPQGLRRFLRGEPGALHPLEAGGTLRLATQLAFEEAHSDGVAA